jgi:sugar lactone lactonase YvrE
MRRIARAGVGWTLALAAVAALGLAKAPARAAAFPVSGASIWTIAGGDGLPALADDGGPAIDAALKGPWGIAVDRAGNVFVADTGDNVVRRIDTTGIITRVAGNGTSGSLGDGLPAVDAELNLPIGVAVDGAGNIYIADTDSDRVRRVTPDGTILPFAGTGVPGPLGDGGPALRATLRQPAGLAVDQAGDVLIADAFDGRIRRVAPDGTISTIAGGGAPGTLGDGGPATAATLDLPVGVAVAANGDVLIADFGGGRVRRVNSAGIIETVAGGGTDPLGDGGPATSAKLLPPSGVAFDGAGGILITSASRVRRVDSTGTITTVAGTGVAGFSGDGGPATSAQLNNPGGVATAPDGSVLVADKGNNRVRWLTGLRFGPAGVMGPPGPAGPVGGPGLPGAGGRLVAVAFKGRVTSRSVTVQYLLNHAAQVTVRLGRPHEVGRVVSVGAGRPGRNVVRWDRRRTGSGSGSGVDVVTLVADDGGRVATSRLRVRLPG